MFKACMIILSCYVSNFETAKYACAVNVNNIDAVEYSINKRYYIYLPGKRWLSVSETPSEIAKKVNECNQK